MLRTSKRTLKRTFPGLTAAFHKMRAQQVAAAYKPMQLEHGFRFGGSQVFMSGDFESAEIGKMLELLGPADVLIDIGANVGFYSCLARHMNKHVLSFEPCRSNLDLLFRNLEANQWSDVEVFPLGLSDHATVLPLYGAGTSASLVNEWADQSSLHVNHIPVTTLDLVLGERFTDKRVVIKMDVEGAELGVLRGAEKLLSRSNRPVWMVEVCFDEHHPAGRNPDFGDVFECFWRQGYKAFTVEENRSVERDDVERWLRQGDRDFGSHNYLFA